MWPSRKCTSGIVSTMYDYNSVTFQPCTTAVVCGRSHTGGVLLRTCSMSACLVIWTPNVSHPCQPMTDTVILIFCRPFHYLSSFWSSVIVLIVVILIFCRHFDDLWGVKRVNLLRFRSVLRRRASSVGKRDRVQALFSADRWRWTVKRGTGAVPALW